MNTRIQTKTDPRVLLAEPDNFGGQPKEVLANTKSLLTINGAGTSAESGLPTFRGVNGAFAARPDLHRVLSIEDYLWAPDTFCPHAVAMMPP